MTATIFDIQRSSFVDGPGIRTTVFFKGCNMRCAWCHNPESQSPKKEMLFHKNRCINCGKCKEKCAYSLEICSFCEKCTIVCPSDAREICGKEYTVDALLTEILKDKVYYEQSGGGVTLSGGECMLKIDFLEILLKKCKENGIHTALDTAGHVPFEYFERVLPYTDLFLYDVKCFDTELHARYTGVTNKLILENLGRLLSLGTPMWIRIPVISGVNDTSEEMAKIRHFLATYGTPERIELLPYHALGEHKYEALGRSAPHFLPPTKERLLELRAVFGQTSLRSAERKG